VERFEPPVNDVFGIKFLVGREVIAFAAHYYGRSPLEVENWSSRSILEWYNEAVKLENEKSKAVNKAGNGG